MAVVALLSGLASGCRRPAPPPSDPEQVVARVGDVVLTVADLEAEIKLRAPGFRAQQYRSPARRAELLDSMIQREMLVAEAERRGYGRDPRVVHAMKQEMVAAMTGDDVESSIRSAAPDAGEIESYYEAHQAELERPEQVRVRQILVKDQARARMILGQARRARGPDPAADDRAFQELVTRHSEDTGSRALGGDLGTLTRQSPCPGRCSRRPSRCASPGRWSPNRSRPNAGSTC